MATSKGKRENSGRTGTQSSDNGAPTRRSKDEPVVYQQRDDESDAELALDDLTDEEQDEADGEVDWDETAPRGRGNGSDE